MKIIWLFFLLLTGCAQLQGPYTPPSVDAPEDWKNKTNESPPILVEWWKVFNDRLLNELEEQGIQNNNDVEAAYQRLLQAYFQARFRLGALSPVITLEPTFFKQGSSVAAVGAASSLAQGLGGGAAAVPAAVPAGANTGRANAASSSSNLPGALPNTTLTPPKRVVITNIEVPLNFAWELDLWGRLSQDYLNAYYNYEKTYFDAQQVLNQITSDIAVNYYLLRGYDTEIEVLNSIIRSRQDNFDINKERYEAGLITYLDVSRAEVDLNSAKSDRENVIRERELQVNILALLVGMPASDLELRFLPLDIAVSPPAIPAGLPAELLWRRPDILSRSKNVQALFANIGVAYAEFYPDVTLSGAVGFASNKFKTLFDWQSRLWQMAVSVFQIIYNGGRLQANLNQTIAAYQESISQYEQAVLTGFREVEDALVNIRQREREEADLKATVVAAEDTYKLAMSRYESGLINYLDVVIAERDLLNYSRSTAVVHARRFVEVALLAKALGGGWEEPEC